MQPTRTVLVTLVAGAAAFAPPAAAQDVRSILNQAMERYQQRMSSIENYTIVQNTLAGEITMYYEKEMVNGLPVFVTRSTTMAGQQLPVGASDVLTDLGRIADHSTYMGRETVDGHATHAIRIDDPGVLGMSESIRESSGDGFEIGTMTMYLDAEEYMPRRMQIEGTLSMNGQTRPITNMIEFTDYRTVDGLLHPFMTKFTMQGVMDAANSGMSPEDIAEARKQIADFEKQLAEMPESQRAMVERMMGDRIEQLRSMLESGGTEFTVEVKEIRVNAGPPGSG